MAVTPPNDDDASLSLNDARRLIDDAIDAIKPVADTETIAFDAALGRVLAHDLISPVDVPAFDNAAMDGYAVQSGGRAAECAQDHPTRLRVIGDAFAGRPYAGAVGRDHCVRIMTGAMMPRDCDAVVPHELTTTHGDEIELSREVRAGQHRRRAGEDLARGAVAIAHGRRITPADLGVAASIGAATITVVRRLRVAVFSTGTELRPIDQALEPGSIHDSNRYALIGMLAQLGIDTIDLGIVRDDPDALEAALTHACSDAIRADAIITSGGVSAGDADYTRAVMHKLGRISFWKLAIKPGRPMAFGRIAVANPVAGTVDNPMPEAAVDAAVAARTPRSALLFGLPGNPVAVMVVFYALVRDALFKLMGARGYPLPCLALICDEPLRKTVGRTEFVRGVAYRADDGWHARITNAQGSGNLRSMSQANCLIVLDHNRGDVAIGEIVEAWPFDGLV